MTSSNLRQSCLWIHRYTGLVMAGFLFVAGLTGSLLAFHEELDHWFNQDLAYIEAMQNPQLPIATLHDRVVSAYPQYAFSSMPTSIEAERSAVFSVDRVRGLAANNQSNARFQEVYVHPYTGDIIGTRDRDEWAWRNTMWKVFWLHRELLLGDIGKLLLGIISLIWTLNCFIGFYLTFPRKVTNKKPKLNQHHPLKKRASFITRWLPAWKIRTRTNTFKLNYDLHHAFGLWLWVILFIIAWSSVGFNLPQFYQPVMQAVVGLEYQGERQANLQQPNANTASGRQVSRTEMGTSIEAVKNEVADIDTVDVVNKAHSIAYLSEQAEIATQSQGISVQQLLGIRWIEDESEWQLRFKTNKDIGKKGGASSITVNAKTGSVERVNFGYQNSSFGSQTNHWLSTLHMGHISLGFGHLLYQVFLALVGLAVSVLSVTGVYLWYKGKKRRHKSAQSKTIKKDKRVASIL